MAVLVWKRESIVEKRRTVLGSGFVMQCLSLDGMPNYVRICCTNPVGYLCEGRTVSRIGKQ